MLLCDAAPLFLPLSVAALLFLPLRDATLLFLPLRDAAWCCRSYFCPSVMCRIYTSVDICEQEMPQHLADKLRSGSQMNNLPLRVRDQALTSGFFRDFQSQDTTQMHLQIVGIYCHSKYKQFSTYLEDGSTAPYKPFNKITFPTWQGRDLNWCSLKP
jgi:hypothetical protein